MAINKKNLLIESFSVLRDSWDSREDSICKILQKMASIDSQKAIEMWEYLLSHNMESLKNYGNSLTHGIIYNLEQGMSEEELAELFFSNDTLCKSIFNKVSDVYWNQMRLLYFLVLKNQFDIMRNVLDLIKHNVSNTEYRVGRAAAETISRFEEDGSQLSPQWVRFFQDYLESIQNPEDKAELVVALIDYI